MEDRLIGCILANNLVGGSETSIDSILTSITTPQSLYFSLLQFILVKRPSGSEMMKWLIERQSAELRRAAREVCDNSKWDESDEVSVYRSLLEVIVYNVDGGELLQKTRGETRHMSARLLGAYLGSKCVSGWKR
jgi:hypothetical protein